MNVLVVGGAGYIGAHTVRALEAGGHSPVVLDNLGRGSRELLVALGSRTPLVEGDVGNAGLVSRVLRDWSIGAVMHFAAFADVGESAEQPAVYYRNNFGATVILLEQMLKAGVMRFVFSSSCSVYGVPERLPIPEDHPTAPINPYGRSKYMVELMLQDLAEAHGLRFVTLRYFNAAGASHDAVIGENHRPETHIIPICLEAAYGRRPHVSIFGTDYPTPDGTCIRDYIHVEDLASAHLLALQAILLQGVVEHGRGLETTGTIYNVGMGRGYSVREVIAAVERITGRAVPVRESPRRKGDPPQLVAEARKIQRELGWKPQYTDLEPIVETAARWFQKWRRDDSAQIASDPKRQS